jgi:predicted DNA-binding transcriptional regulator YafY
MNGGFYLIGFCHLRNPVRTFAMDRIRSFSILDESFHFPKDFVLKDYVQTIFHVIRERIRHPTQEFRNQDDGSVVVTVEVAINYEVLSWILGFGSKAEVLVSPELKEQIRTELEASLTRYCRERS